jgi:hypothetical protein
LAPKGAGLLKVIIVLAPKGAIQNYIKNIRYDKINKQIGVIAIISSLIH